MKNDSYKLRLLLHTVSYVQDLISSIHIHDTLLLRALGKGVKRKRADCYVGEWYFRNQHYKVELNTNYSQFHLIPDTGNLPSIYRTYMYLKNSMVGYRIEKFNQSK